MKYKYDRTCDGRKEDLFPLWFYRNLFHYWFNHLLLYYVSLFYGTLQLILKGFAYDIIV